MVSGMAPGPMIFFVREIFDLGLLVLEANILANAVGFRPFEVVAFGMGAGGVFRFGSVFFVVGDMRAILATPGWSPMCQCAGIGRICVVRPLRLGPFAKQMVHNVWHRSGKRLVFSAQGLVQTFIQLLERSLLILDNGLGCVLLLGWHWWWSDCEMDFLGGRIIVSWRRVFSNGARRALSIMLDLCAGPVI